MLHFRLLLVQQRRHLCRGVGAHRLRPRKHQARGFHDFMFGIRRQLIPHNVAGGGVSRDRSTGIPRGILMDRPDPDL